MMGAWVMCTQSRPCGLASRLFGAVTALAVMLISVLGCDSAAYVSRPEYPQAYPEPSQAGLRSTSQRVDEEDAARAPVPAASSDAASWPMAGANPQRTSWTSEEVRGDLNPIWYRAIEAYVPPNVQVIAAGGLLYLSTAEGLYAFDAATGSTVWVYPTGLPLGNSPTIFDGVAYVGGYDHRIHAIDAQTGSGIWTFEADAGFDTNPLVIDIGGRTLIYAGNRDGSLYALEDLGSAVTLLWEYVTEGPVSFSAAYRDGSVYFASDDAHAYAVDALTGGLVWKSPRLPGAGFQTWWPVLYENTTSGTDVVLLAGSNNYRLFLQPGYGSDLQGRELEDIFPNRDSEPRGTPFGSRNADGTLDATRVLQYFEAKPWRRTYIVLDRATGDEVTFDFDRDGLPEYAPILWHGTHSGNRYPSVVGADGIAYQSNAYMSDPWIAGGQITGWSGSSASISTPSARWIAMDEPMAYSAGGNLIYWSHCNDRSAGAFDISISNAEYYPASPDDGREWTYFSYDLDTQIPGYHVLYEGVSSDDYTINNLFQGSQASRNGIYGQHGHQNPPIPYMGRVYLHRSNSLIAFDDYDGLPTQLPMASCVDAPSVELSIDGFSLREKLEAEVQRIVDAGHLRPGYRSHGLLDDKMRDQLGDCLVDYWHNTADMLYILTMAFPYLSGELKDQVDSYLENELLNYAPYEYTHVGWRDGAAREPYYLPQEVQDDLVNRPAHVSGYSYDGWTWPPQLFYALWKYAEVFGGEGDLFVASRAKLESPPSDAYLIEYPYVHNAYIAGYTGYLELEALAGYPMSADVRDTLGRLLALRSDTFSKDVPYTDGDAARAFSVSRNFVFLVPELGEYLRENALAKVQEAVSEYCDVAPYWFVADHDTAHGESASQHFYDYHALFQARAQILDEPGDELVRYLDVPAVQVGDLFYIQNIVTALQAGASYTFEKTVSPGTGAQGDILSYSLRFAGDGYTMSLVDRLPAGVGAPSGSELQGTDVTPVYDASQHRLTWSDTIAEWKPVTITYRVVISATGSQVLRNSATLTSDANGDPVTATAVVIVNPYQLSLPSVLK